jgi:hypothetical protein
MMISRRVFLASTAALAIAPALPSVASTVPATSIAKPATTMWVGGHWGEFDWKPFYGTTKRDVIRQLLHHHGHGTDEEIELTMTMSDEELDRELSGIELSIDRAPVMDGLLPEEIKGHHWIRAGFGYSCARCDGEAYAEDGGRVVGEEVVCVECTTVSDLIKSGNRYDIDLAEERIVEIMMDHDCDEGQAFEVMARDNDMSTVTPALWVKCLAAARAEL